jgi:DNA-binding response OmpR family regulator
MSPTLKTPGLKTPGLKTIVVEDDDVIVQALTDALRVLGHEVCGVAHDVLGMASLLEQSNPDLIALDLNLGKQHEGVGVATALQAAGPIPIVFVAGAVTEDQRKDVRALEAAALVLMPFTPSDLERGIDLALKRAHQAETSGRGGF